MNLDFDMNLYKTFYVVAKNGSFSKAAAELFVTQPSVSYSIKQLEEKLGTKLFQRNHKGIKITPEGSILYKYIKSSYNMISIGERTLKENLDFQSGEISIGVQSHIGRFFLFPYIQEFNKKYPKIKINIASRNTDELIQLLENNDIDLIIDTSPIKTKYNNIEIEPLMQLEHCFISKENIFKNKTIGIEELINYNLIMPVKRSTPSRMLFEMLNDKGKKIEPFITIETTEMLIDAVKENMGIGYVIRKAVEEDLNKGNLYEIKIKQNLPTLLLNLVYIDKYLTYIPKVFIDRIKEDYKR